MKALQNKFAPMYFVGLCLSVGLFITIYLTNKQPFFSIFTYELHDSYISIYPVWIWLMVFIFISQPSLLVIQSLLRWKHKLWLITHALTILLSIPVLLQVQYILNFHLALAAKIVLVGNQSWSIDPSNPYAGGEMPYGNFISFIENMGTHTIIGLLILTLIIIVIQFGRNLKRA